jgi:aryl-alcohol dehydrogenase-like predicted oxidoreductase
VHTQPSATLSGTVRLGDLTVNRLGFGAMRVTGDGVWGPPADRREAIATLKHVVELGVNFIDTAESYGPHVSEELIAEALHPYPGGLVIGTKGGYDRTGPSQWVMNGRPEKLRQDLEGSLRRLRLERIDLYQLHRIDPNVPEADQFGFLQEAQREGKVRHIGLSEASVPQIERAHAFFRVVSVQNQYNLQDRQWVGVVEHCARAGIVFIPWAPLQGAHGGRSTAGRYARAALGLVRGQSPLERIAARHGATTAQIALAWLLKRSPVMLPIPGTARRSHLEENVAAAGLSLTDEEFGSLQT